MNALAFVVERQQRINLTRPAAPPLRTTYFSDNIGVSIVVEGLDTKQQQRAVGWNRHPERPDVILANLVAEFHPDRIGVVHELDLRPDHKELPNFFFVRHFPQGLIGPHASGPV